MSDQSAGSRGDLEFLREPGPQISPRVFGGFFDLCYALELFSV